MVNPRYTLFFFVFEKDSILHRYRIDPIYDLDGFRKLIEKSVNRKLERGFDSGDINIDEASFIDCYMYPNK